jgi:membrane peptidoglycan carboxypeptidase
LGNAGDSESGRFNLVNGTWFSVNTFYAQLEQRTGLCEPVKLAEAMGVRPATGGHINQYPSFVLGAANTFSPLDVAGAYATMAAHGVYCTPVAITRVTDRAGHTYPIPPGNCEQVVAPGLADTLTTILHGVLTEPGATAANVGEPGRPAAAKTGTADNNVGSNFAGYVPQMAAAVWVGDPRRPTQRSLNGLRIGGRQYGEVFGATIAGPIWHDTLQAALRGVPVVALPRADPTYVSGITTAVPDVSGMQVSDATATLKQAGFQVVVSPFTVPSLLPQGTVARTSPGGGSGAPPGSTVTIYISNGRPPPPSPSSPPASHSPQPSPQPSASSAQPSPGSPSASPTCTPRQHGPARC